MRLLEEGIRSYVILPLNARGRSIGVLALGLARRAGPTTTTAVARVQPLADSVALAFENVRLFQKTRELSITDEVTPLYNFRFFHQILERELKLVDRYKSVLSLIFVDLDRFKPINDQLRPPARQPRAARGRLPAARRRARDRLSGPLRRRRVRGDPAPDRRRGRRACWPRSCAR